MRSERSHPLCRMTGGIASNAGGIARRRGRGDSTDGGSGRSRQGTLPGATRKRSCRQRRGEGIPPPDRTRGEGAFAHFEYNERAQSLGPKGLLDTILKRERWHGRGGGWVADAIYGVNDGLGAVFGIVSGVAGATNNQQHYILVSGLAGMLASSLSMGAGAYLANKSEREIYEAEIAREKAEVEENPEEEIEEMSLFYQLQGFAPEDAQRMAERLAEQPEQLVQAMAQSELGLSNTIFPTNGPLLFPPRSPPRSELLFQSFHFSS